MCLKNHSSVVFIGDGGSMWIHPIALPTLDPLDEHHPSNRAVSHGIHQALGLWLGQGLLDDVIGA